MKLLLCLVILLAVAGLNLAHYPERGSAATRPARERRLPPPALTGPLTLEEAIVSRRSIREFTDRPLTDQELSQLCWAAQGITDSRSGHRAAPSAGALFPIEVYLVTPEGVEHYHPQGHRLERYLDGDHRRALQAAALQQESVGRAPLCMVVTAVVERTARKYGPQSERYCLIEAGHVGQNILLQATALKLGAAPLGAFEPPAVARALQLPKDHTVLYLIPVGRPG